jgi:[NiFe] hydrogenase assembly HybE family chaperone
MDSSPTPAAATPAAPAARPDPSALIERVFADIGATRMQGLPFVNGALRVEAVGFRRWQNRWLGVLVTPWSMNLMILADDPSHWRPVRAGQSVSYALPAGVFDFVAAHDATLGDYQSCSLFSPMFEFADQDGARATAQAALAALFDPGARAGAEGPRDTPAAAPAASAALEAEPEAVVSKRDFLRGRWRGADAA